MLVISHDGKRGYTSNVGVGTISVLDLEARRNIAVIHVSRKPNASRCPLTIAGSLRLTRLSPQTRSHRHLEQRGDEMDST